MVLVRHLWPVTGATHVAFLARGFRAPSSHTATLGSPNSAHSAASSSASLNSKNSHGSPRSHLSPSSQSCSRRLLVRRFTGINASGSNATRAGAGYRVWPPYRDRVRGLFDKIPTASHVRRRSRGVALEIRNGPRL